MTDTTSTTGTTKKTTPKRIYKVTGPNGSVRFVKAVSGPGAINFVVRHDYSATAATMEDGMTFAASGGKVEEAGETHEHSAQ